MTEKQRRFAEYYAQNPNATAAAKAAGYSERTARQLGQRMLTKVDIQKYIAELQEEAASSRIASISEVKTFWSDTMRSNNERMTDRIKASNLLAKSAGVFIPNPEKNEDKKSNADKYPEDDGYNDVIFYDDRSELNDYENKGEDDSEVIICLPRIKTEEECSLSPENEEE